MTKQQLIELVKFTAGEIVAPTTLSDEDAESIVGDFVNKDITMKEAETKLLNLYSVRHSTPRKGTVWYMIFITVLCGLLGGVGWYHLGIEVGIFTLLILIVMFLASIRYNQ